SNRFQNHNTNSTKGHSRQIGLGRETPAVVTSGCRLIVADRRERGRERWLAVSILRWCSLKPIDDWGKGRARSDINNLTLYWVLSKDAFMHAPRTKRSQCERESAVC